MKKSLLIAFSIIAVSLSLVVVYLIQSKINHSKPKEVTAKSGINILPQISLEDGNQILKLYIQFSNQSNLINGITLKGVLSQNNSNNLETGKLEINPDLIQKKWRFPKADTLKDESGTSINLIGVSFARGGTQIESPTYLIATVPVLGPTEGLTLTLDPELSKIVTETGNTYTFNNAGQPIKVQLL